MPNWCQNELSIVAPKQKLDNLIVLKNQVSADDTALSLNNIVPRPRDIEDWYHWDIDNWGTKWDVDARLREEAFDDADNTYYVLRYSFDSAWNPPIPAIEALVQQYPDFVFHYAYDEPGMDFSGMTIWKNGEVYEDHEFGVSIANAAAMMDFDNITEHYWELLS